MTTVYQGYLGKVTIGVTTIATMNRWNLPGRRNEILESSAFTDAFKTFVYGITEGGQAEFSGFFDDTDATGQALITAAYTGKTSLTNLRFYYGDGDTEFFHLTPEASLLVENLEIGEADLSGLVPIKFTLKISNGYMAKVAGYYNGIDVSFTHNVGASNDTIQKTGGTNFAGLGFLAGQDLIVEGSTDNNTSSAKTFHIKSAGVAADVLTLDEDTVTTEIAGDDVSLIAFVA